MYEHLLRKLLRSMEAVKQHIVLSSMIRDLIATRSLSCEKREPCFDTAAFYTRAPDPTDWKIIDHCSAVTQIYASFERFVHELLTAYLSFMESSIPYKSLEKKFRDEHRKRLGQVLVDLDKDRYKALSLESIVRDLANAVGGSSPYRLLPEAMLAHDQNLRMSELSAMCNRCGVPNVAGWASKHRVIKQFFTDQGRQSDTAEAELKQLVEYRNDSAHGGTEIDTVLGPDILVEYADFISALSVCLVECAQHSFISQSKALGRAHLTGSITNKYSDNRAVAIVGKQKFSVGDTVYLVGDMYCFEARILSIMDDDKDVSTISVLREKELGFSFDVEPRKRADIYCITT